MIFSARLPTISINLSKSQNPNYEQPKIEFQIADSESRNEPTVENPNFSNEKAASNLTNNSAARNAKFSQTILNKERVREIRLRSSKFRIREFENQFPETFSSSENPKTKTENQNSNSTPKHSALSTQHSHTPIVDSAAKIPKSIEPETLSSSKIRPLSQLHDSFIIAVDDEGLLLIDQHVAHERILFDKFRNKETARKIESQNLAAARND